jgi:hypothetical protein
MHTDGKVETKSQIHEVHERFMQTPSLCGHIVYTVAVYRVE